MPGETAEHNEGGIPVSMPPSDVLGCRVSLRVLHRQPPHLVEQRTQADAEQPRRLAAVAAGGLERTLDRQALHRLDLGLQVERAGTVTIGAVAVTVAVAVAVIS